MLRKVIWIVLFVLSGAQAAAAGRVLEGTPDNYRELLAHLTPGDTLQLAPGEYLRGLPVHRLLGTREAPIVILGPNRPGAAVFVARPGANTVSILESAYVHIRDLMLDGRGIAVDAVKAEGHSRWAHHITIENLTIVNHGNNQQNVAISTKCPAWGWVVRGNRIHGAGTGMYGEIACDRIALHTNPTGSTQQPCTRIGTGQSAIAPSASWNHFLLHDGHTCRGSI